MDWPLVVIIFNGIFLLAATVMLFAMIRTVVKFNWAYGDGEVQTQLRNTFLKLLLGLLLVGFIAAIVNIFLSWV